jgi:uncharacterized repeat protein (TIGR03803 family)
MIDGADPEARLMLDNTTGDLYGTTRGGGPSLEGTVFKLATDGTYSMLYGFAGAPDGALPMANIVIDRDGNIYGTTSSGGDNDGGHNWGSGTVYKLTAGGGETVLHAFPKKAKGFPYGGLVSGGGGAFYGTVSGGGKLGAVFRITRNGGYKVIHSFSGWDGRQPEGDLVIDRTNAMYGATVSGGDNNGGTVFQIDPDGIETALHSFAYGSAPSSGLIADKEGNLYGTTYYGGDSNSGTVFELMK